MKIFPATEGDYPRIMEIYRTARAFMERNGNKTQWAGGYPGGDLIRQDIAAGKLYVCREGDVPVAVFYYAIEEDPTYRVIEGKWLSSGAPYGVVHRIAVAENQKGAGSFCLRYAMERATSLRIDTHEDNFPMQNLLKKLGFIRCGIIYLPNGDPRIAFEYIPGTNKPHPDGLH